MNNDLVIKIKVDKFTTNKHIRHLCKNLVTAESRAHLIQQKHLRFLVKWHHNLQIGAPVRLYAYKYGANRDPELAGVFCHRGEYWLGISDKSLHNGTDWQNSLIHELLHIKFDWHLGASRKLSEDREEYLVVLFSAYMSRSKEGRAYLFKRYGK